MAVDLEALRRLNAEGASLRAAATKLGIPPSVASQASSAAVPPILWDRSQTRAATNARVADARARRAELHARQLELMARAQDFADLVLDGTGYRAVRRGEGGREEEVTVEGGTVLQDVTEAGRAIKEFAVAAKAADPGEDQSAAEHGKSLVGDLMDALRSTR